MLVGRVSGGNLTDCPASVRLVGGELDGMEVATRIDVTPNGGGKDQMVLGRDVLGQFAAVTFDWKARPPTFELVP